MGEYMLPMICCGECRRLTREECGLELEEADCPTLCESCGDRTQAAWEAHRDKNVSVENMITMMKRD